MAMDSTRYDHDVVEGKWNELAAAINGLDELIKSNEDRWKAADAVCVNATFISDLLGYFANAHDYTAEMLECVRLGKKSNDEYFEQLSKAVGQSVDLD